MAGSYKCRRLKLRLATGPEQPDPPPPPPPPEEPPPPPPPEEPPPPPPETPPGVFPPPPPAESIVEVDFLAETLDARLTVTRTGEQAYLDTDGLLKFAAANTWPRMFNPADPTECLGRWREPPATNQYPNSTTWAGGTLLNATQTVDPVGVVGPEGDETGVMRLRDDATLGSHYWQWAPDYDEDGQTLRAYSFMVAPDGWSRGYLQINGTFPAGFLRVWFNLNDNSIVYGNAEPYFTAEIEDWPDGWKKVLITPIAPLTADASPELRLGLADDGFNNTFAGDGSKGLLFYGLQPEVNPFPTGYIRTSGTTASRGDLEVEWNDLTWLDPAKGTFVVQLLDMGQGLAEFPSFFRFENADASDRIAVEKIDDSGTFTAEIVKANVRQFYVEVGPSAPPPPPPEEPPPPPPPPEEPEKKPIWYNGGTGLSQSVLDAYNAIESTYISFTAIDNNGDGKWDGRTSLWNGGSGMSRVTSAMQANKVPVSLDWEGTSNSSCYGNFAIGIGGLNGTSAACQDQAEAEGIKAINAAKEDRPGVLWGFYDVPRSNQPEAFLPISSRFNAFTNQYNVISANFLQHVDVIHQRAYVTYKRNDSITGNPINNGYQCSKAQVQTMMENMALLGHRCADKGIRSGFRPLVVPYCSIEYFASGLGSLNGTVVPDNEWIYWWIYYYCNFVYNGRKADGVYIWSGSSDDIETEAQLKAIYQAVNGLPYDPGMPRPT